MAASPSSSPRLPSPPPIAEDQLGPKSPIAMPNEHGELGRNPFEANASRRIRPGTKAADMATGPPLVPLTDIDSPFQLTEHLKSLHNAALYRDGPSTVSPIDRETATRLAHPPEGVDKYLWLYELCRLLCKEINSMIVALFQDDPPCSAQTCSEMRASEWQYLCAVHDPPKPCCAIDYCCHTLDWTNHVLTSQKNFPSRLAFGDGGANNSSGAQSASGQLRQLTNIFRRVYRIFAHAWFQHRDMYWKVELKSGLYVFFKTVCDVYNLIPEGNYTVPPEAEGIEPAAVDRAAKPNIMKRREEGNVGSGAGDRDRTEPQQPKGTLSVVEGATTKRHRHTPSVGSESITTVLEDPEEEDDKAAAKAEDTVILSSDPPEYSAVPELSHSDPDEEQPPSSTASKKEPESKTEITADNPTISVEHAEDDAKAAAGPTAEISSGLEPAAEGSKKHVDETAGSSVNAGEKEQHISPSSIASDTDSHGSWQVLTDEPHTSSGDEAGTPPSSAAPTDHEPEVPKEPTTHPDAAETKLQSVEQESSVLQEGEADSLPIEKPKPDAKVEDAKESSVELPSDVDETTKETTKTTTTEDETAETDVEPETDKVETKEKKDDTSKDEPQVEADNQEGKIANAKADATDASEATKTVDD